MSFGKTNSFELNIWEVHNLFLTFPQKRLELPIIIFLISNSCIKFRIVWLQPGLQRSVFNTPRQKASVRSTVKFFFCRSKSYWTFPIFRKGKRTGPDTWPRLFMPLIWGRSPCPLWLHKDLVCLFAHTLWKARQAGWNVPHTNGVNSIFFCNNVR